MDDAEREVYQAVIRVLTEVIVKLCDRCEELRVLHRVAEIQEACRALGSDPGVLIH